MVQVSVGAVLLRTHRFDSIVTVSTLSATLPLPSPTPCHDNNTIRCQEDPTAVDVCDSLHGRPAATTAATAATADHVCTCLIRVVRGCYGKSIADAAGGYCCWCCSRRQNRSADPRVPSRGEGVAEHHVGGRATAAAWQVVTKNGRSWFCFKKTFSRT